MIDPVSPPSAAGTPANGPFNRLQLPHLNPTATQPDSRPETGANTGSSFNAPTDFASIPTPPSTSDTALPPRRARLALTIAGRLLLLGVGLPLAWLVGIGAAQVLGHRSHEMPLQETALRRANRVVSEVRYLPNRWQQPDRSVTRVEPVPIPTDPIEPLGEAVVTLSDTDRQVALEEVDAIATELRSLNRRLIDLEARLGRAQSTADVQSRLAAIRTRLTQPDASESSAVGSSAVGSSAVGSSELPPVPALPVNTANPLLNTTDLQVTLPSDALFVPGEARLLETAPTILSTILSDLNRYPNATILIGSHTDDRSDAAIGRELAFRQARVLQAYLAQSIDRDQRWVSIGYGQSQPLGPNDTPEARQRNRRVEISVDRR